MKKFLATLLACALSAASVFSLTACDGSENDNPDTSGGDPNAVTTLTEDGWLNVFYVLYFGRLFDRNAPNFIGEAVSVEVKSTWGVGEKCRHWYDSTNNIYHEITEYPYDDDIVDIYYWQEGDKCYEYINGYKSGKGHGVWKSEVDSVKTGVTYPADADASCLRFLDTLLYNGLIVDFDEETEEETDIHFDAAAAGITYDENNKVYKCTFYEEECTMKFENGKLIKIEREFKIDVEGDDIYTEGTDCITYAFNYDNITVTVPQEILDMEVNC